MKRSLLLILLFVLRLYVITGCNMPVNKIPVTIQADSLKKIIKDEYIPGTGEIMNEIVQSHHYKLWLAGQQQNWILARYESHLLSGGFKRIQKYHAGTPEALATPMIYPELEAVDKAIARKSMGEFKSSFVLLTNACNSCHQATGYQFNVIKVPKLPSFDNQKF